MNNRIETYANIFLYIWNMFRSYILYIMSHFVNFDILVGPGPGPGAKSGGGLGHAQARGMGPPPFWAQGQVPGPKV